MAAIIPDDYSSTHAEQINCENGWITMSVNEPCQPEEYIEEYNEHGRLGERVRLTKRKITKEKRKSKRKLQRDARRNGK